MVIYAILNYLSRNEELAEQLEAVIKMDKNFLKPMVTWLQYIKT